jgi:hypothetical protein
MSLWCIENVDDAGEGMFLVDAPSESVARTWHRKKNGKLKITSCEKVKWVDLALVSGKLGESYYFERGRQK